MSAATSKVLVKAICARNPALRARGDVLILPPLGRVLRGICLEASTSGGRYIWAFIQPLYVPAEHITFNLGTRLGGQSTTWVANAAEDAAATVEREGIPLIEPFSTPADVERWPDAALGGAHVKRALAYSMIAGGDFERGAAALSELSRSLGSSVGWVQRLKLQVDELGKLAVTSPNAASELLERWQVETIGKLGLANLQSAQ